MIIKRFRSMPLADSMIFPFVVIFPVLIWSISIGFKIFSSEEFIQDPLPEKLFLVVGYSFFLITEIAVLVLVLFLAYHYGTKWAITSTGLEGTTPLLHKKRLIPWENVQTAFICNLYGSNGKPIPGVRFCLDKESDERVKNKKCGIISGWPKCLDSQYVFSRPAKYIFIYEDSELFNEVKKYYPAVEDIRLSQRHRNH